MPERTSYKPGTPCWVDVTSPDTETSAKFYGELFGWDIKEPGTDQDTGGYRMFTKGGKFAAGLTPMMQEGMPPFWTSYVCVEDADSAATAVKAHGGKVFLEPMDVLKFGRMAVFADDAGAGFAVWQAGDHIGCEVVNESGALCWNELDTREPDGAKKFYGGLFGWNTEADDKTGYVTWKLGDAPAAGMMEINDQFPPDVPNNWLPYFGVDDTDAAAERTKALGGKVIVAPMDSPAGRFACLADPHGAVFAVIELSVDAA